jgi:Tol biopolymer transport system component
MATLRNANSVSSLPQRPVTDPRARRWSLVRAAALVLLLLVVALPRGVQGPLPGAPAARAAETQIAGAAAPIVGAGKILYRYTRCGTEDCSYSLWVMDPDGFRQSFISGSAATLDAALWSPDGSRIAVGIGEHFELMNADGSGRRIVYTWSPDVPAGITGWTSDGKHLLFLKCNSPVDPTCQLNTLDVTSGSVRSIGSPCLLCYGHTMSPDGTKIAFSMFAGWSGADPEDIYVMRSDGTNRTRITSNARNVRSRQPDWSPDGTKIATQHYSVINGVMQYGHVEVINADGSGRKDLTNEAPNFVDYPAVWGPDGSHLAYNLTGPETPLGVYVIKADGTGRTKLPLPNNWPSEISQVFDWQPVRATVRSVRFADDSAVVQDRRDEESRRIDQFRPSACASGADWQAAWLDCDKSPDGTPEKVWPVTAVRNKPLTLKEVRFRASKHLSFAGATLTAEIRLEGATQAGVQPLRVTKQIATAPTDEDELVITDLTSQKSLPDSVEVLTLAIQWEIEVDNSRIPAGTSRHPLYLLQAEPIKEPDSPAVEKPAPRYLTLVDIGTRAAAGKSGEQDAFKAIWSAFETRELRLRFLSPEDGTTTLGPLLTYWTPWSMTAFMNNNYDPKCAVKQVAEALKTTVGRCGAWSGILVSTLALQGVASKGIHVGNEPIWKAIFPDSLNAQYMLVDVWGFRNPSNTYAGYPYEIWNTYPLGIDPPTHPWQALYLGNGQAQGHTDPPPGLFQLGDHDVVMYDGAFYDPSYGTGPFAGIRDWAERSLAGYATWAPPGAPPSVGCVPSITKPTCKFYIHQGLPGPGVPPIPTPTPCPPRSGAVSGLDCSGGQPPPPPPPPCGRSCPPSTTPTASPPASPCGRACPPPATPTRTPTATATACARRC